MPPNSRTRKVELVGRGPSTLRPSDYLTSGGEAAIFRIGETIVKVYSDPAKMRRDGMAEKIVLLSKLSHEFIIAPMGVVTEAGEPIGYYMPFTDGEPLSRVFTNDFRTREGFDDAAAKVLVSKMYDTVQFAHKAGVVMVDANELNWVVRMKGANTPSPRVLDVDSWAVGKWHASVIMPSIRDWNASAFTALSDWFSWAVVTFQVWTGIHPYKGTLAGFGRADLEARMRANKSVFTKGVTLNRAVRDFGVIPSPLRSWYEAAFENGERGIPPSPLATGVLSAPAAKVLRVVTSGEGTLVFEKLLSITNLPIVHVFPSGVAVAKDGGLYDLATKRAIATLPSPHVEIIPVSGGYLAGWMDSSAPRFAYIDRATGKITDLTITINARAIVRAQDRMFLMNDRGLLELVCTMFGKPVLSLGTNWGVLGNSTKTFSGVLEMDALGAKFLVLPFGDKACAQLRVPELDKRTALTGKAGPRYAVLITADNSGKYERLEFSFDKEYKGYTFSTSEVDGPDLNIAILPKGVAAQIENDGELSIIVPSSGTVKKVADKTIATDMSLANWDDKVLYIQNGAVWSLKMK
jgi:hypothetical protein